MNKPRALGQHPREQDLNEAAFASLRRLHEEGVVPNAEKIGRIFLDGDLAVLFFEVGDGPPEMAAESEQAARALGWKGGRVEVARMTKTRAAKMADALAVSDPGDTAGIAWLRRHSGMRLLVFVHVGTLCVDYVEGEGLRIAPGTTDHERMS